MYCAPEVLQENQRRGRAADVFSMSCVFLEISTVLLGPRGSLDLWSSHREKSGSRIYSDCSIQILQWIFYLWGHYNINLRSRPCIDDDDYYDLAQKGTAPADIAFHMLDPNPLTRITTRQMVALCNVKGTDFFRSILIQSCKRCRKAQEGCNSNTTLYSVYKSGVDLEYPPRPAFVLGVNWPHTWEGTKKLWLSSHM